MDIAPDKQNIDSVFSNNTYYIDFYQRQYKWNEAPVSRLLDDIFYKFNEEYNKYNESDVPLDQLISQYSWYYLNTYVTNIIDGKLYVVDGQQRLTTITLILIKLYRMSKLFNSKLDGWLKTKIIGQSGYDEEFWMKHEAHNKTMQGLLDGKNSSEIDTTSGISAKNMVANYIVIDKFINDQINDLHQFECFVFYFLKRLVLINLCIERTEVPMVFEVINDRGERLKPYEILKGKLLGQVSKEELESLKLNQLWDDQVNKINAFKDDEIDQFFIYYLKSKLADTRGTAQKFDKDYHRVMFSDDFNSTLKLKHNPKGVKTFLQGNFKYYTNLFAKLQFYSKKQNNEQPFVFYNKLTDMNTQYLLILSACSLNDLEEDDKIYYISRQVDRFLCLLQLQRAYNSNAYATNIYTLSSDIREKKLEEIKPIFEKFLLSLLSEVRNSQIDIPITYAYFKDAGYDLEKRFTRYFFARIDKFIGDNTKMNLKHSFNDLVTKTGAVNGFHVEHILANNEENRSLFNNDDEYFERERNRLGGLLLLKGRDNISSNDEVYEKKLSSYANTLYWNETLREDTYKSKLDFRGMITKYNLEFKPMPTFGPKEIEERHKLLFNMIKIIWE